MIYVFTLVELRLRGRAGEDPQILKQDSPLFPLHMAQNLGKRIASPSCTVAAQHDIEDGDEG